MKTALLLLTCLELSFCCQNVTEADCVVSSRCVCSKITNRTDTVICCNINSTFKFNEGMACGEVEKHTTKHLHIFNYTLETFNASLSKWENLESLAVTGGKFKRVSGQFSGGLNCVNFSSNVLLSIDNETFTNLPNLHTLDISKNNLTRLPQLPVLENRILTLDISGNTLLKCKNILHLFAMDQLNHLQINHKNKTSCNNSMKNFHWFTTSVDSSWDEMVNRQSVEKDCPKGPNYQCNCSLGRMEFAQGQQLVRVNVLVDCSGRQLTELPKQLPPNTLFLNVSNNNISSLDRLINDSTYRHLRNFLADNNKIDNIKLLEGSHFMNGFSILSFKDNKIKSIPTYLFSNMFNSPWEAQHVNLGGNRLNCDCNTAQSVKLWLNTNSEHIRDYDQIFCDKDELGRVIDLDLNQVCIYQKDWTEYIYYIIAGEILLLVLLVSKVSYDYWIFKTSGYLPWPASKIPKLPCDWVFET